MFCIQQSQIMQNEFDKLAKQLRKSTQQSMQHQNLTLENLVHPYIFH